MGGSTTPAMRLGLDGLLGRTIANPLHDTAGTDLDGWLARLEDDLGAGELTAAVFWPPQPGRGRVYVHLFNGAIRPVGFAKLSLDRPNDVRRDREAAVLAEVAAMRCKARRVSHEN